MTQAFNLSQLANNLNTAGQLDATDGLVNAVPVANGGTGASTDSAARTNLNVPTRTGGDASGTWAINISGNAATATNATTAASCTGNSATVTNGVYTTNFTGSNQSLGNSGYQKLPGGLIMQWGNTGSLSGNQTLTVTYPIAFLNACFNVQTTVIVSSDTNEIAYVYNVGTSSFVVVNSNPGSLTGVYWLAFGY